MKREASWCSTSSNSSTKHTKSERARAVVALSEREIDAATVSRDYEWRDSKFVSAVSRLLSNTCQASTRTFLDMMTHNDDEERAHYKSLLERVLCADWTRAAYAMMFSSKLKRVMLDTAPMVCIPNKASGCYGEHTRPVQGSRSFVQKCMDASSSCIVHFVPFREGNCGATIVIRLNRLIISKSHSVTIHINPEISLNSSWNESGERHSARQGGLMTNIDLEDVETIFQENKQLNLADQVLRGVHYETTTRQLSFELLHTMSWFATEHLRIPSLLNAKSERRGWRVTPIDSAQIKVHSNGRNSRRSTGIYFKLHDTACSCICGLLHRTEPTDQALSQSSIELSLTFCGRKLTYDESSNTSRCDAGHECDPELSHCIQDINFRVHCSHSDAKQSCLRHSVLLSDSEYSFCERLVASTLLCPNDYAHIAERSKRIIHDARELITPFGCYPCSNDDDDFSDVLVRGVVKRKFTGLYDPIKPRFCYKSPQSCTMQLHTTETTSQMQRLQKKYPWYVRLCPSEYLKTSS